MNSVINDPTKRHDFVLLFDVADGNPNGDPDAGNLPRLDPETMQGLVTDVCIKRKVRNYVDALKGTQERFKIYIQNVEALSALNERAYTALDIKKPAGAKAKRDDIEKTRQWMCDNFYDIRMFGAVLTIKPNCGQVRGPMQLTFARSIDPIIPFDISITRIAITRKEDMAYVEVEGDQSGKGGKVTEMGRKAIVPYGLYRSYGFYNPLLAEKNKSDSDDLAIFWDALQKMWEMDRSASRGLMACRGLYVFTHESPYGNAPAHQLFDRIKVAKRDESSVPRSFADYEVRWEDDLPSGVTLTRLVT
jgi:CRISPR-associated protein Csd2